MRVHTSRAALRGVSTTNKQSNAVLTRRKRNYTSPLLHEFAGWMFASMYTTLENIHLLLIRSYSGNSCSPTSDVSE